MAFFKGAETPQEARFNRIIEYLDSQKWKYDIKEQGRLIEFRMGLKGKIKSCRMLCIAGEKEIQAMAFSPINAEASSYADVVEFITRANYGLKVGKFEMDYRDGEVRFQACLPCRENVPDLADVEHTVDMPMLMLQRYGDGLVKNLMGFGDPAADIQEIEG